MPVAAQSVFRQPGLVSDQTSPSTYGLNKGDVRLTESDPRWATLGDRLAADIRRALGGALVDIEHVGSTAVPGLAAKPIIDRAVGLRPAAETEPIIATFESLQYEFRGDAGQEGGLVFVLSDRPLHRVAHLHVVIYGDHQWRQYLKFRDRLRVDSGARNAYAELKRHLSQKLPNIRKACTDGKSEFVEELLSETV